ncbi:histidine kinase [Rhizobium sp. KVB221]|uniref:Histidine kinase n=1 Tax=Rhizobium setariae TaxID=2801340 RepID=A0A937CLL6_9HYPH|nr:histidine kinase [Rhizobium setariae]MBL0373325.1 histidine kinase [Rhizobium setariae]
MKTLIAAAVMVATFAAAACAETLNFPSEAPIASITIPDNWGPTETESGIEATSDDKAIYISIDIADAKTSDKVIDDAIAFLEKNGVKIDGSTQKQSDQKLNGMDMTNFDWTGTDSEGDVNIGLSILSPKAGKLLVITYWGSKGTQEKHAQVLGEIITSLKPAGE